MAFTPQELANIANAALDYHFRDQPLSQTKQARPLLDAFMKGQKTFPGGKDNITVAVKGVYSSSFMGFSHDDQVAFRNPANAKRASFPYKEVHDGIMLTLTELKKNGISVMETATGENIKRADEREMIALHDILEDKFEEFQEGWERGMNLMFWQDGTQDSKQVPGVLSIVLDAPTSGTTGGLDRSLNSWWQNRASLGLSTASASNLVLVTKLQNEFRQLRRYGGKPNKFLCGSSFLDWFEQELRSKGNYTLEGWANKKSIDASVADLTFKGVDLIYDPTLDDLGRAKYGYVLDTSKLYPMVMSGEDRKQHQPARPADRYVMYRAMTWTGGLICKQLNAQGVYSIA
jgi:hypothetical protein